MKRNMMRLRPLALCCAAYVLAVQLSGCGMQQIYQSANDFSRAAHSQVNNTEQGRPVVAVHAGAWLLGERIDATKPQPELYDKWVQFEPTNKSTTTLGEIADFITTNMHVPAVIDSSVSGATESSQTTPTPSGATSPPVAAVNPSAMHASIPGAQGFGSLSMLPTPAALASMAGSANKSSWADAAVPFAAYRGYFRQFLDIVDTRFGVWSHYKDGKVTFLRTETRVFQLPILPEQSTMTGSVSTGGSSNSSAGAGSMGGAGTSTSTTSSSSSSSDQNIVLVATSNPWANLQKTAQTIAGPAAVVVADKDLSTLTVRGSPIECDRVEDFVKNLNAMYGKQIEIDVTVYQIQESQEHNYGANLTLAYKSSTGHTGLSATGASIPTLSSSSTPMSFGATILSGPLSGSSAAFQALSTLGKVNTKISRSGVTQNGKQLTLQSAVDKTYVSGSTATQTASVGSTSTIQTAEILPGFTSSFTPKLIDGRILVSFDMTISGPATFTQSPETNGSSVQLLNMPKTRMQQSIGLRPGETLVLTGMRQQDDSTTNNGVGSPFMPLIGGGADAQGQDTVIAVAITARLL